MKTRYETLRYHNLIRAKFYESFSKDRNPKATNYNSKTLLESRL
jgi:hypothetical protein